MTVLTGRCNTVAQTTSVTIMIHLTALPTALYGFSQAAMATATIALFSASVSAMYLEQRGAVPPGHYEWLREERAVQSG